MRAVSLGLAIFAAALAGPALGMDETEQIEESEMPGSEIELDIGDGEADAHRKGGGPVLELGGENDMGIQLDPAYPQEDPIDQALPGEGPENLSGPFDED